MMRPRLCDTSSGACLTWRREAWINSTRTGWQLSKTFALWKKTWIESKKEKSKFVSKPLEILTWRSRLPRMLNRTWKNTKLKLKISWSREKSKKWNKNKMNRWRRIRRTLWLMICSAVPQLWTMLESALDHPTTSTCKSTNSTWKTPETSTKMKVERNLNKVLNSSWNNQCKSHRFWRKCKSHAKLTLSEANM